MRGIPIFKKAGILLLIVGLSIFVCCICFASEAYLDDVIVDIESYEDHPDNIFSVGIDADTPSDDLCEYVKAKVEFYNFSCSFKYTYEPSWEVCGTAFHPETRLFTYDPESIESNHDGLYACSEFTLTGNVLVDSYDSSIGPYGSQNNSSEGNIYSNGTVELNGNVVVNGNVTAHEISINGNSHIEGSQTITGKTWDCMTGIVDELHGVVTETNNNDVVGLTLAGDSPFNP